ncbi:SiaB family protein kinase [Pseudomonas oryzihabitans]|uniref:SiaB family protein kinase n=1 Tax=Pseudomonas oryzihabitans TaxID=47885 RepID=UPI003EC03E72
MLTSLAESGAFLEIAQQQQVIFYHHGYFSHGIVAAMAEVVKLQLEFEGISGATRRKLFSSFIELSQNVLHYSADALPPDTLADAKLGQGSVCITRQDGNYQMLCANPIVSDKVQALRARLEPLCSMSIEQIKQAYRESLRAETPTDSKGAGLGFLTMARDASAPLEFAFHPSTRNPGTALFCLKAII